MDVNIWLDSPRAKAATAAFIGNDYNNHLWGVTMQSGVVEELVRGFLSQPDREAEDRYLEMIASNRR